MARLSDLVREQSFEPRGGGEATSRRDVAVSVPDPEPARRWIAAASQEMRRVGEAVRSNASLRLEAVNDLARQLVRELHQSDEHVRWALRDRTDERLIDNALHVAVLSVKVGIGLDYFEKDLERLAAAGLLHDVGMWALPAALVEKTEPLTEEERVVFRSHPERGRRILAELGSAYEWLSTIVAQEHERWDGRGYPCRLKGAQIAEEAQIIGVADVFDALITPRSYRKHIAPHQALRELLVHGKTTFSHRVLKALGDQVTLYPLGTAVRLNTGEIGTVSRINPRSPLRPIVLITGDGRSGLDGEASELDLSRAASMHIVEVLQAVTVS